VVAVLLATAAVAVGTAAALGTTEPAAKAKPKWLTIRGFWEEGIGPAVVGSASGRGWIGFASGGPRAKLGSLGRAGGRLSFAGATVTARSPMSIVGSQLLYHLPDISGTPGPLRAIPLLANGRVGTPGAIPDDPEKVPPQELDPAVIDAVRIGNRAVWIVGGSKSVGVGGAKSYLWACCTATGELRDLTRFIKQNRMNLFWQLELDSHKRLWLAWLQPSRTAVVGPVKLLELDPETLAARTSAPVTLPGGATSTGFALSCGAVCRVVMTDLFSGDVLVSSPGQRSPTRIASGTRERPATLLAASECSGHLVAASIASRDVDFGKPSARQVLRIEVVRADARGSRARPIASVDLPDGLNQTDPDRYSLYQFANAAFVPGGLVYFAVYYGYRTPMLAGFLQSC
jgi:hypothetical protein